MKTILGIETSCDETAAAILQQKNDRIQILSNIIASSASLQAKFGGVIPEYAAREQIKSIIPVIKQVILDSLLTINQIDAISVTYGPGLIGSLLVGVETAKVLSVIWNKPLIPINHLLGHFYANWIDHSTRSLPMFPFIGLLISGGHTDLLLFTDHNKYKYLGGTRDDASGECFDKCARLLGLSGIQGGAEIAKLAQKGNPNIYKLPRPMINSNDFDFSFSGLKTSVSNIVSPLTINHKLKADLAASIQQSIVEVLIKKAVKATQIYNIDQIVISGGVAANLSLKQSLSKSFSGKLFIPPPSLCTDNGAMVAAAGFFTKPISNPLKLTTNPSLGF